MFALKTALSDADLLPERRPSTQTAMVITKTPFRISFFGGGTDYPQWYLKEGGAVLSTTIDKYCYISCRILPPFFQTRHRVVWSHVEAVSSINEILHPSVRNGLQFMGFDDSMGIEIHHQGDLPARSGIGSSSSFSVGLLRGLAALKGRVIGKKELAQQAIQLEQEVMKELVGSQDQVAAAYGGLNLIQFQRNGDIQVEPMTIGSQRRNDLQANLMLLYTGTSRLGAQITKTFVESISTKEARLRAMRKLVDRAVDILASDTNLDRFGELLHEGWMLKREYSNDVSNEKVDSLYERARAAGALGGKLLGAGHSGFMLFYVPQEKQAAVQAAMPEHLWVPFAFDRNGCTLVHYND